MAFQWRSFFSFSMFQLYVKSLSRVYVHFFRVYKVGVGPGWNSGRGGGKHNNPSQM